MNNEITETIHRVIKWCALGIKLFAVSVIVGGFVIVAITRSTFRYLFRLKEPGAYESYELQLGRLLLMGLTPLVACDVGASVN